VSVEKPIAIVTAERQVTRQVTSRRMWYDLRLFTPCQQDTQMAICAISPHPNHKRPAPPPHHTLEHFTTLTPPDDQYKTRCSSQSSNIHPSYMPNPSFPVHCTTLTPDNLYTSHCSSQSSNIHLSYMSSPSHPVHYTKTR
jgi:hypothetical protein